MWIHNYIPPYVVMAWDFVTASMKLTFLVSLDIAGSVKMSTERPAFLLSLFLTHAVSLPKERCNKIRLTRSALN